MEKRGVHPQPRRRVNNKSLLAARRATGKPNWLLAVLAGITHQSRFASLINADSVPATDANIRDLHRIADAIGFPKSQLFLLDEQEEARS